MKAAAVVCIAVSLPGTIIAAALYPTIRENPALAGALVVGLPVGALLVIGLSAFVMSNAVENGVTGAMAARGIAAATGNYPPGGQPDYIDVQHRIAQTRLTDARAAQVNAATAPALPPAGWQVDSVAAWDERVGGGWGS